MYALYTCFFFKQKTAYELRISDWSSDVCSSDLRVCSPCLDNCEIGSQPPLAKISHAVEFLRHLSFGNNRSNPCPRVECGNARSAGPDSLGKRPLWIEFQLKLPVEAAPLEQRIVANVGAHHRSEEHTSELQSLMRISYAVFCLNKK